MWIGVISLFPDMFRAITDFGVTGRAVKRGLLEINLWNPRDFAHDKHRTVDDRPYGVNYATISPGRVVYISMSIKFSK